MDCESAVLFVLLSWFALTEQVSSPGFNEAQPDFLVCDLVVDAGPDVILCSPDEITLMGSVTGNTVHTEWMPATGLSDPFILNPDADITGTITYTLTALGFDPSNPNLVVNGDFESGNTGFTTDYNYLPELPGVQEMDEGEYGVHTDPNDLHWGWEHCGDHTTGDGNMMMLNGAPDFQNVWCQTIAVSPNSWYDVSAWVSSVHPSSPAILQFSINGNTIGPVINAPGTTCVWLPFNAVWYSGSSTSASLCILNQNTTVFGNDFAIDDISMVELCSVEDEVTITIEEELAPEPEIEGPVNLCPGETATYTVNFPSEPEIISYVWIIPPGATLISGQGTPEIDIIWDEPQDESICLQIETGCDQNEGCFEVIVNDIPDEPEIIGAQPLCPGESIVMYTPENPDEEYEWTVSPEVTLLGGENTNEIEIQWGQAGEAQVCLEVSNACGANQSCISIMLSQAYVTFFDTVLCSEETIIINGTEYGNGVWSGTEEFISVDGCDSTVMIEISEAPGVELMQAEYLCSGDSIFLAGMYQTQSGTYIDSFLNLAGCDSIVFTEVIISEADSNFLFVNTCNPAEAGIFIATFTNGNCDSIVITEISLIASDTTFLSSMSCFPSDTGRVTQLFSNQAGCDSLVITDIVLGLGDTTFLFDNSCDLSDVGTTIDTFINMMGCDSIIITSITFSEADTTLISNTTCSIQDTGTTSALFVNFQGCDSLVITSIQYAGSDTLFLLANTCFPADSGRVISSFINQFGCDSIVSAYYQLVKSDTTIINTITCEPSDTGSVAQLYFNIGGCDSLVITNTALDAPDNCLFVAELSVIQPLCYGDTAWINVDFQAGASPYQLFWENGTQSGSETYTSPGLISLPLLGDGDIRIRLISANGLSVLDTLQVDQLLPLMIEGFPVSNYSGYNVPCYQDSVAEIQLDILSQGTPPLYFSWSNGETTADPIGIPAGLYSVTVTDANGCTQTEEVVITEPLPLQYELLVMDIPCAGDETGSVEIINPSGGVSPWSVSVDGKSIEPNLVLQGLTAGMHSIIITDQNNCAAQDSFTIAEPATWTLTLGTDTTLVYGATITVEAQINGLPAGPLTIEWSDGQCQGCISRDISVTEPFTLQATVTDDNGCSAQDEISFFLSEDGGVFIPNVFTPNGDLVNDYFFISASPFVEEISELSIYDRWGDHVFQRFHFQPNEPSLGWDGMMRDQVMNPAVFAFKALILFRDGRSEWRYGDVTLVR